MDYCKFRKTETPNVYRCEICGAMTAPTESPPERIYFECRSNRKGPSWLQRIKNFAVALASHIAVGSPRASQADINARLEVCAECPLFNGSICTHANCGCNVTGEDVFMNKLSWADSTCPAGRWGAVQPAETVEPVTV